MITERKFNFLLPVTFASEITSFGKQIGCYTLKLLTEGGHRPGSLVQAGFSAVYYRPGLRNGNTVSIN